VGETSVSGVVHQTVATVRTQLDDLMAELEAGSRFVDRIQTDVAALDGRLVSKSRQREGLELLTRRLADLRGSVTQQRMLMTQLRECVDALRRLLAAGTRP
jgi:predicted RNase H-like nuclease (RuvC/YqgF family)